MTDASSRVKSSLLSWLSSKLTSWPWVTNEQPRSVADQLDTLTRLQAALPDLIRADPALQQHGEVLPFLIEVHRRQLKGTNRNMFSVRVWGSDWRQSPSTWFGERYSYRTGKTSVVRKNQSLKLAISEPCKRFVDLIEAPVRGGSIITGLRLSAEGRQLLAKAIVQDGLQ